MKTLKIALFSDTGATDYHCIFSESTSLFTKQVRVSEWVEVSFPARTGPDAIAEEVARIDGEIEQTIERNVEQLKALKARKTAALSKIFATEEVV